MGVILDLFAGPGGWDQGLRDLGYRGDVVGVEWDAAACQTRAAAGHATIRADVAAYPTGPFAGKVTGLIASPPCQDFSLAGKRAGIEGERGQLVAEVLRWARALEPEWIACEQVPPVLPIWELYAHELGKDGYRTWAGILNAADYGVPQTRKRAILLAHRSQIVGPPEPTHQRYVKGEPQGHGCDGLFGTVKPWVSMADALGWGITDEPCGTITAGGGRQGGHSPLDGGSGARERYRRAMREGRWVVDRRTNSKDGRGGMAPTVTVPMSRPSPTLTGKAGTQWIFYRPATTVVGSFCPDVIAAPGYRTTTSRQNAEGSVKVTIEEAAVLQSFPPDYPWQGSKTKQFEQVGNAIPPGLAAAILDPLIE